MQWKYMKMQADGLPRRQQMDGGAAPVVVAAQALCFGYPGLPLWDGASHQWRAGLNLVRGGEGCGKTSLLQALAGQLPPQSGRVEQAQGLQDGGLFWKDPRAPLPEAERQQPARDWVQAMRAAHAGWDEAAWQSHVRGLGLEPHLDKPLLALSTGSLRKLWMAAGWASGAPLLLIDEPLAALDRSAIDYVQKTLAGFAWPRQQGRAARCVIVAHWDEMQGIEWDDVLDLPEQGPLR